MSVRFVSGSRTRRVLVQLRVILERNGRDSRRSGVTNSLLALLSNMAEIVPLRDVALCH